MYNILVVDDEKIGRVGISFLLKKSSFDFSITEAPNGKVALEYIENNPIDLLITDIKMPFMDGLELIKNIKKLNLNIKTIILSGYSDFEYAKNAMKMGVSEYLLKPIDPQEFELSLETIINEYENEKKQKKQIENHLFLMKEHILSSLINGNSIPQIEKKLNTSIHTILKPYKRMMLLEFADNFFGENLDVVDQFNKFINTDYDYLNLNLQQSILFFNSNNEEHLKLIAKEIILNISLVYNKRIYIAISKELNDLSQIQNEEIRLEELLDRKYLYPNQQLYLVEKKNHNTIPVASIEELIMQMNECIKIKDLETLKEKFYQLQDIYIENQEHSIYYLKFLVSPLIKTIHSILSKSSQFEIDSKLTCFYQSQDAKETMDLLYQFILELENVYSTQVSFEHKEIEAVKKYIYTHYNLDISVDQLADYVCLAPSYLSHIFKKETGENLSKFIKRVRMEKAKDMLENSYEKIVTVSVAVGYQNVSYFCQSFREYFGISPQKFRSQGEK